MSILLYTVSILLFLFKVMYVLASDYSGMCVCVNGQDFTWLL